MSVVIASISVSLDGYFTGPRPGPSQGLGEGGEVLHEWLRGGTANREQLTSNEIVREAFERSGAMISGRDSYDVAERAWGPEPPFEVPVFVLTHRPQPDDVRTGTTFHFIDGFDGALAAAREAAGASSTASMGRWRRRVRPPAPRTSPCTAARRSLKRWRPVPSMSSTCNWFRSCSAAAAACSPSTRGRPASWSRSALSKRRARPTWPTGRGADRVIASPFLAPIGAKIDVSPSWR
jgi:dihydrofolate reductase